MGQFSKPWNELTFADNYIFCKVMLDEELCKKFIEILLDISISKIEYLNTENLVENYYDSRGVRLDVYVKDSDRVFDIEMQTGDYDDLLLRARYYQSASDVATTKRRTMFKKLKESFILFVCVDDPFGAGIPVYTRKMEFLETDEILYNDKSHAVFYNASAYDKVTDNEELKAVLRFVYENKAQSEYTDQLDVSSKNAKSRSEWEDDYMYFQDILEEEKELAREAGHAEGLETGLAEGRQAGLAEGRQAGRAEGREEGREEMAVLTAKNCLKEGDSPEKVSRCTGLSLEKINELAADLK